MKGLRNFASLNAKFTLGYMSQAVINLQLACELTHQIQIICIERVKFTLVKNLESTISVWSAFKSWEYSTLCSAVSLVADPDQNQHAY